MESVGHTVAINPLSAAKGKKFECEICGQPSLICCNDCKVAFYCQQHQEADFKGIHEKICSLLIPLRSLAPIVSSEDDRLRRNLTIKMSQHALLDLCKNEASSFLVSGNYEWAIPGAIQSLRFAMEVYGTGHMELVPSYLLLAEANLGLSRFKLAEEFLSLANWNVLKNPNCSNSTKSQLFRLFGKLYASQGRYEDALLQLAHDIYHCSLEVGPEHIDTAAGFYYTASVFLLQDKIQCALASFDKVVDVWYKFLTNLLQHSAERITDYLGEAQIVEALEMLKKVLETRGKYLGTSHIATGEAAYTLGLLMNTSNKDAAPYYLQAYAIYYEHLGPNHDSTMDIFRALEALGVKPEEQVEIDNEVTPSISALSIHGASPFVETNNNNRGLAEEAPLEKNINLSDLSAVLDSSNLSARTEANSESLVQETEVLKTDIGANVEENVETNAETNLDTDADTNLETNERKEGYVDESLSEDMIASRSASVES